MALPPGAERGLLIHRAIELLGQGVSPDRARKSLDRELTDKDWIKIQEMTVLFMKHLQEKFEPIKLHWEVPVASRNSHGSFVGGTIDLLVETHEGYWIVDHKSDDIADRDGRFARYLPQLDCYARVVSDGVGFRSAGVAIHWVF